MNETHHHLDAGSLLVIAATLVLFIAALYVKGIGHDLLLEAGVFLVSVKLIIMGYKNGANSSDLNDRLDRMEKVLASLVPATKGEPGERS